MQQKRYTDAMGHEGPGVSRLCLGPKMREKIDQMIEENRFDIERWAAAHNHKENVAYLSIPFNAVLLNEALQEQDPFILFAYVAAMWLCHIFLCDVLRRKRRLAVLIGVASAINRRLRDPREEALELLDQPAENWAKDRHGRLWVVVQHVFPTRHIFKKDLSDAGFDRNEFYAKVTERQAKVLAKGPLDRIPAFGSLAMTLFGSSKLALLVACLSWQ